MITFVDEKVQLSYAVFVEKQLLVGSEARIVEASQLLQVLQALIFSVATTWCRVRSQIVLGYATVLC